MQKPREIPTRLWRQTHRSIFESRFIYLQSWDLNHKSPTSQQKSPTSQQQSPTSQQKSPTYQLKRRIYPQIWDCRRTCQSSYTGSSMYRYKSKKPYISAKEPSTHLQNCDCRRTSQSSYQKSPTSPRKCPTCQQKSHIYPLSWDCRHTS